MMVFLNVSPFKYGYFGVSMLVFGGVFFVSGVSSFFFNLQLLGVTFRAPRPPESPTTFPG